METKAIALFGEAEKGAFQQGFLCGQITELMEQFGNPPPESRGLHYAVQVLLYQYHLIFFRVEQEGFSKRDYFNGIKILTASPLIQNVHAIYTPGVGDRSIINALVPLCHEYHQILITNEADFYDYLSSAEPKENLQTNWDDEGLGR